MEFRQKVLPLVISGTLAFGTMGAPLTAIAASDEVKETNDKALEASLKDADKAPKHAKAAEPVEETVESALKAEENVSEPTAEPVVESKQTASTEAARAAAPQIVSIQEASPDQTANGDTAQSPSTGDSKDAESASTPADNTDEQDALVKATPAAVIAALEKLPEASDATLEDAKLVQATKAAYDKLSPAEKLQVGEKFPSTNEDGCPDKLQALLDTMADLQKKADEEAGKTPEATKEDETEAAKAAKAEKEKADKAAVDAVIAEISALPELDKITAADEKAVYAAKASYYALTDEQRNLVDATYAAQLRDAIKAVDKAVADEKAQQEQADEKKDTATATADAIKTVRGDTYQTTYPNQGYTRIKYTANLSTEMFIASIGEQARQIGQENGLYASVMIAQAIIESDSGNSGLAKAPNNNLFGIKGAFRGQSVNMATQEDDGSGGLYSINSDFRKYESQKDSLADYANLLRNESGAYAKAWKENAATYEDAARSLQGTYATSTIYADSICAVIEAYDLTRYDKPLDFKIVGKAADGTDLTMNDYADLEANAVSFLGTPYVWGGSTPEGFDCSGLVQYLYKETLGIQLPRTTYAQQFEGVEVPFSDLQMGDLLFFVDGGSTEHVAMYLGDGFYIHAPERGDIVKIADMESYTPSFAKRIITTTPVEQAPGEQAGGEQTEAGAEAQPAADTKAETSAAKL